MNQSKKKSLETAGWKFGDAADILSLGDSERQLLDARVELALAVRRQREFSQLTQRQLGLNGTSSRRDAASHASRTRLR